MTISSPIETVSAWNAALVAGDPAGIAAVTDPDVEMVGPRGSGFGLALVQDWAIRSGIRLEPRRSFARDDRVVVEQVARWRDAATGELGEPTVLATAFTVQDRRVTRIARYPDLSTALEAADLTEHDLIRAPTDPPTH